MGVMRSLVKRRAVSISALCSSDREKSTTGSLLHSALFSLELAAHRPGPEGPAGDEPDHEDEGDVDDVLGRHLRKIRDHAPPLFFSSARARATAPSSAATRSSIFLCRRHDSRMNTKSRTQKAM